MKKLILSTIALGALSLGAYAQTPDLKLGAKAGVNFANITDSDGDMITSFHVGVLAEIFVNEKFSIQPEVLYSSQGSSEKLAGSDIKLKLDYINVPIMAKYYLMDGLNVQAGPQVGFLTTSELEGVDVKDAMQKVDFGINLGAGYELPMGVFFDARYNMGLTKIAKSENDNDNNKPKNGVIQVSVGYKF